MKLLKLTCPNCGANLEISTDNKEIACQYCRTPILLDEEIIKVEHTIASPELTEKIKVANTYLYEFEDYKKAYETFRELSTKHPYEAQVWWGLILAITKILTQDTFSTTNERLKKIYLCDEYMDKYLRIEKDINLKTNNNIKYLEYINHQKSKFYKELLNILTNEDTIDEEKESEHLYQTLKELSKKHNKDPLIWWCLLVYLTNNFGEMEVGINSSYMEEHLENCNTYFNNYINTETDINKKELNSNVYNQYMTNLNMLINQENEKNAKAENFVGKIFITIWVSLGALILLAFMFG